MAEPKRNYSINDILRNNQLLNGALYWSVFFDDIFDPSTGSWPDSSKIYVRKDPTSSPKVFTKAQAKAMGSTPIMHGFAKPSSTEFEIQCYVEGLKSKEGETPQHERLIKFRVDTFLACAGTCPEDGKTTYAPGANMSSQQSADPGDTSSAYFYYGTSGADQMFVKVDRSWPCDANQDGSPAGGTARECISRSKGEGLAPSYWNYKKGSSSTDKALSYQTPCSALRLITGTAGNCYPDWIEFNYVCDPACMDGQECDGGLNDKARLLSTAGEGECCQTEFGVKPAVGDLIKIDKVGNEWGDDKPITSGRKGGGSHAKIRECYIVTEVTTDQPTGVTSCTCSPQAPLKNTLGIGHKCISSSSKLVERRAPGEQFSDSGCYGAEDRYNLRDEIIKTLTSLGWGENIGGFVITGFTGTLLDDDDYAKEIAVNRMIGHGHFTRTAFSLPGNASSIKWEGGNSWLTDHEFYVDESSWRSMVTHTSNYSMTFIDRWRQTIEMAATVADPVKGTGETHYELVNAWPPEYLEMFVKRTMTNAATASIGYNSGRSFEVGLTLSVDQVETEEEGEFPRGGESTTVGAKAYIKFTDLLNYTMKRHGHVNTGGDPEKEFKILRDYLTIDVNFGSKTDSMTWEDAMDAEGVGVVKENFTDNLFKGFEASANYGLVFSNGFTVSVGGINFNDKGWAEGVNPSITITSPMWKDVLGFTITQNMDGGGTLGIMFNADKPIYGKPGVDKSKLFIHGGVAVNAGWGSHGSAPKYEPSLQFYGQVGSLRTEKFSDILNGFEYDFNLLANKGTLTRTYDFTKWTSLGETASADGGFTIEANVNNPNASLFTVRGDLNFEWTVKDFGKFWGKLIVRATATIGLELGMPGAGGLEPGGAEFGISFGIYASLDDGTFLEWLGFPFNINPGIGLGLGFKVNFKATSTLTRMKGGGGAVAGPQSNLELKLGPIQWNLSRADGLRQHMEQQHNSWANEVPFFGSVLGQFPIITALGGKESLFQYIIRASVFRSWMCIGLAAKSYFDDVEQAYKDGEAQYITTDLMLSCDDAQREAKARHRSTYYDRYSKGYILFSEGKEKKSCGPKKPGWKFDPKDCYAKNVTWRAQCHFAAKQRDEWVLMNPPCQTIRARWVKMVKDHDYKPFNTTKWPELKGVEGIISVQMHYTEEFVWSRMFERCLDIDWDDRATVFQLVSDIYDGCNFGGYEHGKVGVDEHGIPIESSIAGLDRAKMINDITISLMAGRENFRIPLVGETINAGVAKVNGFFGEGFSKLAKGGLGWSTAKTLVEPDWPCFKNGCRLDWSTKPVQEMACDKAWVQWNYYMDVFYYWIQRWHAMAHACVPYKATCGMISRGAAKGIGFDPWHMSTMPLGLNSVAKGGYGKGKRLNLPYGEWVTMLKPQPSYARLLIEAVKAEPEMSLWFDKDLDVENSWTGYCNAKYFWYIYWELLNNKETTNAIDQAAALLSQIDACSRGFGSDCAGWPLYPITEEMKKCVGDVKATGCPNRILNADGTGCTIDDYWDLWLETYPDQAAKEATDGPLGNPFHTPRHANAATFFECICKSSIDSGAVIEGEPTELTCTPRLPEMVLQGDWGTHYRDKILMTMPFVHGNKVIIKQILADWSYTNGGGYINPFVSHPATPINYSKLGGPWSVSHTTPWDCALHASAWQGEKIDTGVGNLSFDARHTYPGSLAQAMFDMHAAIAKYLDAGPGSPGGPGNTSPSQMPASNQNHIIHKLQYVSLLSSKWPVENQDFPVKAWLNRIKRDLQLYSKMARCLIMESHFGNKNFKLNVSEIVSVTAEEGWSEEDKSAFWEANDGVLTLDGATYWWTSVGGEWTTVSGSNQTPKNEISTPDPKTPEGPNRAKKEGGSVFMWSSAPMVRSSFYSAFSKAVATFCFNGGISFSSKMQAAILRSFQCALCNIDHADSADSPYWHTTVDLAWLLLGRPTIPRIINPRKGDAAWNSGEEDLKMCPGGADPAGAISDLGAIRSLLSEPNACDPASNCAVVWESTSAIDRGRLAELGHCALHLCGKNDSGAGGEPSEPMTGGYVNNFDPRANPWGTGIGEPGNAGTLAGQQAGGGTTLAGGTIAAGGLGGMGAGNAGGLGGDPSNVGRGGVGMANANGSGASSQGGSGNTPQVA